jgi:cytidylate kinase
METNPKKLIIAIDGHSSSGKSTVAKDLAKILNYIFIDSGAMYRAVTLFALQHKLIGPSGINEDELKKRLPDINITFQFNVNSKKNVTFLNGIDVEKEIRSLEVSQNVSAISAIGFVRNRLVELQQAMGKDKGIVMDGRDIGTVVFPQADLKVFMTASPEIRAQRRFDELAAKSVLVSYNEILENVKQRDHIDSTRSESPLKRANDAVDLDNSNMTPADQLNWIMGQLREKKLI